MRWQWWFERIVPKMVLGGIYRRINRLLRYMKLGLTIFRGKTDDFPGDLVYFKGTPHRGCMREHMLERLTDRHFTPIFVKN